MGTGGATALLSPECDAGLAVRRLRGEDKSMPTSGDWRLTQTLYNLISKEHDLQSAIRNRKSAISSGSLISTYRFSDSAVIDRRYSTTSSEFFEII
jgi:hypothetical protein